MIPTGNVKKMALQRCQTLIENLKKKRQKEEKHSKLENSLGKIMSREARVYEDKEGIKLEDGDQGIC